MMDTATSSVLQLLRCRAWLGPEDEMVETQGKSIKKMLPGSV